MVYNTKLKHISNITPEIVMQTVSNLIKPVGYIPFDRKLDLVIKTIEDSKSEKYVTAIRYRNFIINLISAYTNIEMDEKGFDLLSENQMLDIILSTFQPEYEICSNLMQMCLMDKDKG